MLSKYKGREQAYIKHQLLGNYLEVLFMIIGYWQKTICYVDCFSGPWQENSEDLMDTSIGISLMIMAKCKGILERIGKSVNFRALYIEKDTSSFSKLEDFLNKQTLDIETSAFNGNFFDLRERILDWCGHGDFAFFFIDPTGWKDVVEPNTLLPFLQRPNSEILITFMFDFLLRFHKQDTFKDHMKDIFGEIPDTNGMHPKQTEDYLLSLYRNNLKNHMTDYGGKPRIAYTSILDPTKDRTKYELVYLTHHPRGIIEFMDASEKLEIIQREVRGKTQLRHKEERSGQTELFEFDPGKVLPDSRREDDAMEYWLRTLGFESNYFGNEELADMLEETGWFPSDLQRAFGSLLNDQKVENLDIKGKRRSRFVHFEANNGRGERLRKLTK